MIPKITELTSLTFAVEDLNFIVQVMSEASELYYHNADLAEEANHYDVAHDYSKRAYKCLEIARAIALAGQQGIG